MLKNVKLLAIKQHSEVCVQNIINRAVKICSCWRIYVVQYQLSTDEQLQFIQGQWDFSIACEGLYKLYIKCLKMGM